MIPSASWGQSPSVLGDSDHDSDSDSVASREDTQAVVSSSTKYEENPEEAKKEPDYVDHGSGHETEDEPLLSLVPATKARDLVALTTHCLTLRPACPLDEH